jgi:hypothetical protein
MRDMTRLDEIKARVEAATKGPWFVILHPDGRSVQNRPLGCGDLICGQEITAREEDMTFTAHAREDIPWLLAEVGRLRGCLADYDDMQGRLDDTNSFAADLIGLILDHCGEDGGHPDDQYTVSDMDSLLKKKGEENAKLREMLRVIDDHDVMQEAESWADVLVAAKDSKALREVK